MKQIKRATLDTMEKRFRTKLINSLSGFKSVNLVGTTNGKGQDNLSIVSSVFHLGANPPLMGFIMRPISVTRDTYYNIMETKAYTFNHITSDFFKAAHQTSARYPEEISEFEEVGLTPQFNDGFVAPFVKESLVRIGLKFREKIDIQLNGTIMIIGEIMDIHFPEAILSTDGYLDIEKAGTVTCSGLDAYHTTNRISRLSYAKPNKVVKEIE